MNGVSDSLLRKHTDSNILKIYHQWNIQLYAGYFNYAYLIRAVCLHKAYKWRLPWQLVFKYLNSNNFLISLSILIKRVSKFSAWIYIHFTLWPLTVGLSYSILFSAFFVWFFCPIYICDRLTWLVPGLVIQLCVLAVDVICCLFFLSVLGIDSDL